MYLKVTVYYLPENSYINLNLKKVFIDYQVGLELGTFVLWGRGFTYAPHHLLCVRVLHWYQSQMGDYLIHCLCGFFFRTVFLLSCVKGFSSFLINEFLYSLAIFPPQTQVQSKSSTLSRFMRRPLWFNTVEFNRARLSWSTLKQSRGTVVQEGSNVITLRHQPTLRTTLRFAAPLITWHTLRSLESFHPSLLSTDLTEMLLTYEWKPKVLSHVHRAQSSYLLSLTAKTPCVRLISSDLGS